MRGALRAVACSLACAAAACSASPSVVVTVEDPAGAAGAADHLEVSTRLRPELRERLPLEGRGLPATFVYAGVARSEPTLVVRALEGERELALGQARVRVPEQGASASTVVLRAACAEDADCDDGRFCNGVERCAVGRCEAGAEPCAVGPLSCLAIGCDDARAACRYASVAEIDDGDPCTRDLCGLEGPRHEARADGDVCEQASLPNGGRGVCVAGACEASVCGDGYRDPRTEVCDLGVGAVTCVDCEVRIARATAASGGGPLGADAWLVALSRDGRWLVWATQDAAGAGYGPPRHAGVVTSGGPHDGQKVLVGLDGGRARNLGEVRVFGVTDWGAALAEIGVRGERRLVLDDGLGEVEVYRGGAAVDWAVASADGSRVVVRLDGGALSLFEAGRLEARPERWPDERFTLTPDGRYLVSPTRRLDLDTDALVTTSTAGVAPDPIGTVFTSDDGARVVYSTRSRTGSQLLLAADVGGRARTVARMWACGASFSAGLVAGFAQGGEGFVLADLETSELTPFGLGPARERIEQAEAQSPAECAMSRDAAVLALASKTPIPLAGDTDDAKDVFVIRR